MPTQTESDRRQPVHETHWHRALSGDIGLGFSQRMYAQGTSFSPEARDTLKREYMEEPRKAFLEQVVPLLTGEKPDWAAAYEAFDRVITQSRIGPRAGFLLSEIPGASDWMTALNVLGVALHSRSSSMSDQPMDDATRMLIHRASLTPEQFALQEKAHAVNHLFSGVYDLGKAYLETAKLRRNDPQRLEEVQANLRERLSQFVDRLADPTTGLLAAREKGAGAAEDVFQKAYALSGIAPRWSFCIASLHAGTEFCTSLVALYEGVTNSEDAPELGRKLTELRAFQRQTLLPLSD